MRNTKRAPLEWQSTLGAMVDRGVRLKLTCSRCPGFEPVNVSWMLLEHGPDTMIWDRREPCPRPGCTGERYYLGSTGTGTPFRPLKS